MVKKNKIYILFIVSLILVAASLFFAINKFFEKPLQVVEYDVFFVVRGQGIGLDVNNTFLTFGQVNPGGGGRREVIITNAYDFSIKTNVLLSRNLFGLIDVETGFIIPPAENKTVSVRLNVPRDYALGNYTGKIKFEIYKAK